MTLYSLMYKTVSQMSFFYSMIIVHLVEKSEVWLPTSDQTLVCKIYVADFRPLKTGLFIGTFLIQLLVVVSSLGQASIKGGQAV